MRKIYFTLLVLFVSLANVVGQTDVIGQITDLNGEAVEGATVYVASTQTGAVSDANGKFQIGGFEVGREYEIRFSFVGFKPVFKNVKFSKSNSRLMLNVQFTENTYQLKDVLVYSTRIKEGSPFAFTDMDKEEIEENNLGVDVPYLLQWTPSAVVTSDAGAGIGYTGIRIRGSAPTATNVTINGIPLNDAESHGVFWVDLPDFASSVQDIQIQRGVGTSTNGAGAFGASINLNTNSLEEEAYVRLGSTVGSFNTLKTNVQAGTGLMGGKFLLEGRISKIDSDGYIDRASSDLDSWFASAAYVGKRSLLRFNAFSGHEITYQAWNGTDPSLVENDSTRTYNVSGTEKPGEPYENEVDNYRQDHYQLLYNYKINKNFDLNLAGHYTRGLGYYESYKAGSEVMLSDSLEYRDAVRRKWLDNHFYGATYSLNYRSTDTKLNMTFGGAYNEYLGRHFGEYIWIQGEPILDENYSLYDNDSEKSDFNAYLKVNYDVSDRLSVLAEGQIRLLNYTFVGVDDNGVEKVGDASLTFFNPKFGLNYKLTDEQSVYGSFAIANREPNRDDYVDNPVEERPSHETLTDYELGYRWSGKQFVFNANAYYMDYENQLVSTGALNSVGAYIRTNIPESVRMGIELDVRASLADRLIDLGANATVSKNTIGDYTAYLDVYDADFNWVGVEEMAISGQPLSFSPALTGALNAGVNLLRESDDQDLSIALLSKYVGKQYIDNMGNEDASLPAYNFSNIRAIYSKQFANGPKLGINLTLRNIFNQKFSSNAWSYGFVDADSNAVGYYLGLYPQAGRNFLLGLSLEF
jgi:iron complex outermembrane receptor protein